MANRLPPKVGHIFCLAAIISDVCADLSESAGQDVNPIALAKGILEDPRSQWAPAQEVTNNG